MYKLILKNPQKDISVCFASTTHWATMSPTQPFHILNLHINTSTPESDFAKAGCCSHLTPQTRLLNEGPDAAFLMCYYFAIEPLLSTLLSLRYRGLFPCCSHDNFCQICAEILIILVKSMSWRVQTPDWVTFAVCFTLFPAAVFGF